MIRHLNRAIYLASAMGSLGLFFIWWKWRLGACSRNSFWISPSRLIGISGVHLGSGVRILHHARIEILNHADRFGQLTIGNNVHIGHNFFCTSGIGIKIGDGVLMSDNVAIIDNTHINSPGKSSNHTGITCDAIDIGKNVVIYRNATILKGVSIGEGAVIGAGSVVNTDVEAFSLYAGAPARFKKRL